MIGQKGPKHVGVGDIYNIVVYLLLLCAFLSLNDSYWIVIHGIENMKYLCVTFSNAKEIQTFRFSASKRNVLQMTFEALCI